MYFSLGEKESKPRNLMLRSVRQNTEKIQALYQSKGTDMAFQLNPGNHYNYANYAVERIVSGICWMISILTSMPSIF